MAKSRRRSASKGSTGAKKKAVGKRAARKRAKKAAPKSIELRGIRQFAEKHIAAVDRHPAPSRKAVEVRSRMQQLIEEIRRFCGPDMSVPLA